MRVFKKRQLKAKAGVLVWVSIWGDKGWSKKKDKKETRPTGECIKSQDHEVFKLRKGLQKGEVIKLVEKRQPI